MKYLYLILLSCFPLLISCQNEEQIDDLEKELGFSCFAERITLYWGNNVRNAGSLISERKLEYNQRKQIVTDSSFNLDGSVSTSLLNTYDDRNRILIRDYQTYTNNGSLSIKRKREYTYIGSDYSVKLFATLINNSFGLTSESFYKEDKLIRTIYYDINGNEIGKAIYTYIGELLSEEIRYSRGEVSEIIKYEYDSEELKKVETYDSNEQLSSY